MNSIKRISINTSIVEARIFADSSDEDEITNDGCKEPKSEIKSELSAESTKSTVDYKNITIKQEKEDSTLPGIKAEPKNDRLIDTSTIKTEHNHPIESESTSDITDIKFNGKVEKLEVDTLDPLIMESLLLQTPVKSTTEDSETISKSNLKSVKRTLAQHRSSPYSKEDSDIPRNSKVRKPNLDQPVVNGRKKKEMESDPEVLARRQKQIDFGKNTIGYDNYSQTVNKLNRAVEDPATPNKYKKYSRRAWDGLIKQWRLKLHKYDM